MTDDEPVEDAPQPTPDADVPDHVPPLPVPSDAIPEETAEAGDEVEVEEEPAPAAPAKSSNMHWYVVKVQSAREESIKAAIEKGVKREGLEEFFGQIVIPVEKVTEMVKSKRVVKERKLYPGYLMVEVDFNDRILYLFRETSGVGDFVGGGLNRPPPPMTPEEVLRMKHNLGQDTAGTVVTTKPKFDRGDRVKVKDGTFVGMEGEVKELLESKSLVRVEITIFGRGVPVELEYWQVELV